MHQKASPPRPCSFGLMRSLLVASLVVVGLGLAACSGSGGSSSLVAGTGGTTPRLAEIEFGRLVDVYGLDSTGSVALFLRDVLIGRDIEDERTPQRNPDAADSEITFDFLSADADTLQPRLLITREIGSTEFETEFDRLDDELRAITPAGFGQVGASFSVVPRNAGFRLTFSHDLGITEEFFVERNANGVITGQRNTEAVQLLEIVGDPNDADPNGDFVVLTSRFVPRGNHLIVDPVLLGSEGRQYGTRNNASGLPESPDQLGANIRLAVALEGPLAIPGVRPDRSGNLTGTNNGAVSSVIRDFRSGNSNDNSPDISQGFVRDSIRPRISGQIVMYVERVEPLNESTQVVTLFKNNVSHEIDRGDVLRLVVDNTGVPAAVTEVSVDPVDDAGRPQVQKVRAIVRRQFRPDGNGGEIDIFEEWDPSDPTRTNTFWQNSGSIPAYPTSASALDPWLVQYAPRGVLIAEFTAQRLDAQGNVTGDDPRFFVTFTPSPLPDANGVPSAPNENISPFAGGIVRFTKPVDLGTVKPYDTFFFATRDLLDPDVEAEFISERNMDPQSFVQEKYRTPHLVAAGTFDEDGSQTSIRLQPSLGSTWTSRCGCWRSRATRSSTSSTSSGRQRHPRPVRQFDRLPVAGLAAGQRRDPVHAGHPQEQRFAAAAAVSRTTSRCRWCAGSRASMRMSSRPTTSRVRFSSWTRVGCRSSTRSPSTCPTCSAR